MRRLAACGVLCLWSVAAAADGLDAVMNLLAARRHGETSFVEQQFLSVLKAPVESWGELVYDAPGRLEKRTLGPRAESLVLDGGVVTVQRGRRTHTLDLKSYPQLLPFVDSLRATLAGDRGALERVFRIEFSGDPERWTLVLVPSDAQLAKDVARVRIDGARAELLTVEIRQRDGDRSLMTLRPHPAP